MRQRDVTRLLGGAAAKRLFASREPARGGRAKERMTESPAVGANHDFGRMLRSLRLVMIPFLILAGVSVSVGTCYADNCPASKGLKDHPLASFKFRTGYYEEKGRNGYRDFHTCVENISSGDMHVIWYVPAMNGWVPDGRLWDHPRKRQDGIPHYPEGCISYSYVGETEIAQFSGTPAEEKLATAQASNRCTGLGSQSTPETATASIEASPRPVKLTSMSLPVSVNFPSDLSRPRETMLEFKGEANLEQTSDSSYRSITTYTLSRVEGRPDGNPELVRIKPMFRGLAERLYSFFNRSYPDGFAPLESGRLGFDVSGGEDWAFSPAVFAFVDRDNRVLAEMEIPAFVPQPAAQ